MFDAIRLKLSSLCGICEDNTRKAGKINDLVKDINQLCTDIASDETRSLVDRLEQDIEELTEQFRKEVRQKDKYKTIAYNVAKASPDMIWMKDLEGKYVYANDKIIDGLLKTGSVENTIGRNDVDIALAAKKKFGDENHTFGEICGNSDLVVIKTCQPRKFLEYGKVDGKDLYLEVFKEPAYDGQGTMIGTVGSGRDVTEYYLGLRKAIDNMKADNNCRKSCSSLLMCELDKYKFEG